METKDVARLYDTILSIPGMNDTVKLDFKLSRKLIMLLESVVELGLSSKDDGKSAKLVSAVPAESVDELRSFIKELLQKAGLTELSEKLKALYSER